MKTITSEIAKEKGDQFEQFIVKKFPRDHFVIKEWRGDKYIDGIYAESNLNPDLEVEYRQNGFSARFAVECKYRQYPFRGCVQLGKERQLAHYKNFSRERNIPVYIALGLGGSAEQPADFFLIPLDHLQTIQVPLHYLRHFRREVDRPFCFDVAGRVLR